MTILRLGALAVACGLSVAGVSAAQAQSFGNIVKGAEQGALQSAVGTNNASSLAGGDLTSGLLGSMGLPSLSTASTGNITGVLSYCVQNKLVSSTSTAQTTLNSLTGKSDVKSDTSYASGQQGILQLGNGNQLSLDSLKAKVRKKMCNAVLNRASSLL